MSELRRLSQIAIEQKASVLNADRGGYSPTLHDLFRVHLPALQERHKKGDARDALFLLLYLQAWVNGTESNDYYMWAFPTVTQIHEDTGIHGDRISRLCELLETEGLLITKRIPWNGHTKKMYLPLFYPNEVIPVNGAA